MFGVRPMGSGLSSRLSLAQVGRVGIHVLGSANGLCIELSLGFAPKKRTRYMGWLGKLGSMLWGRPIGSGLKPRQRQLPGNVRDLPQLCQTCETPIR